MSSLPDPAAARRQQQEFRDARGKHEYEDAAMKIVEAIHRHIVPAMDDNDGGEILGWILDLAETIHRATFTAGERQQRETDAQIAESLKAEAGSYYVSVAEIVAAAIRAGGSQ